MKIKQAEFLTSNTDYKKCPTPDKPEFAFIGRSNVGKSSLINALTNRNKLAKISSKPGKTQTINHFLINQSWYLVDLPGYGWSQVSKAQKEAWGVMITSYFENRQNLVCTFVLIDSRLPPQEADTEFMEWMVYNGIPFVLVFTKVDKLSKNKVASTIAKYRKILLRDWEEFPLYFTTSSVSKDGIDELVAYIEELI